MDSSVYLSIGSNSGDRYAFIRRAVAALAELCDAVEVSQPFVSKAWGFESDNEFVNVAAVMHFTGRTEPWTVEQAHQLLADLQQIERNLSAVPHRNEDGSYHDREIDIDIIEIDNQTFDTPILKVPHPLAAVRPFVTIPLASLKTAVNGRVEGSGNVSR